MEDELYVKENDILYFDKEQDKWARAYLSESQKELLVVVKWGAKKVANYKKYLVHEVPCSSQENIFEMAALLAMEYLQEYVEEMEDDTAT